MSAPSSESNSGSESRGPIRLTLRSTSGPDRLDGGWWPYSRDLAAELPDLVRAFPASRGRIVRALFSRPDWDSAPRRIPLSERVLKVGSFPGDDTHVIVIQTSNRESITLLVIPPSFSAGQGAEALLAASTPGNTHHGEEVLREVTDQLDADPASVWERHEDGTPVRRVVTA